MIDYKFNEHALITELQHYINQTYSEHYSKSKFQSSEFIMDCGHGMGFFLGNVLKYSQRYGKKDGNNRKDLFKSINNQLIITVLDNICEYGIKNTLKAFKNDIIDNKINNIEIETLVDISSWIDDSVQNNHSIDDNIPDYIYDEIEKLKNR